MEIIVLVPGILCVVALLRWTTQRAFLDVCLPVLLLVPTDYFWKVASLPPISFIEAVMVPLGAGMVLTNLSHWRFSRADLWMALFVFTAGYADYRVGRTTTSIFGVFQAVATGLIPYMAGKLLIEQPGARVKTIRRFVWLLFAASIPSMYEYFMKANPFSYFWSHFFRYQWNGWVTQIRWGFGRVAGPYSQSELAGMVLFTGLILTLWLSNWSYWEPKFKQLRSLPLKKATVITATLALTLFMTQARGPWFGAILAWSIAFIGRADNLLRRSLIVGGIALAIVLPGYVSAKRYLNSATTSSEQQTAQYRQQLTENYLPVAELGGTWGWGMNFPRVGGQNSIDNEYLFVYLVQGYMGLIALVLLMLEAAGSLLIAGLRATSKEDCHFSFSLLGILAGFVLTLGTVFLGSQAYVIFFMLIGWSQAIRVSQQEEVTYAPMVLQEYV